MGARGQVARAGSTSPTPRGCSPASSRWASSQASTPAARWRRASGPAPAASPASGRACRTGRQGRRAAPSRSRSRSGPRTSPASRRCAGAPSRQPTPPARRGGRRPRLAARKYTLLELTAWLAANLALASPPWTPISRLPWTETSMLSLSASELSTSWSWKVVSCPGCDHTVSSRVVAGWLRPKRVLRRGAPRVRTERVGCRTSSGAGKSGPCDRFRGCGRFSWGRRRRRCRARRRRRRPALCLAGRASSGGCRRGS